MIKEKCDMWNRLHKKIKGVYKFENERIGVGYYFDMALVKEYDKRMPITENKFNELIKIFDYNYCVAYIPQIENTFTGFKLISECQNFVEKTLIDLHHKKYLINC